MQTSPPFTFSTWLTQHRTSSYSALAEPRRRLQLIFLISLCLWGLAVLRDLVYSPQLLLLLYHSAFFLITGLLTLWLRSTKPESKLPSRLAHGLLFLSLCGLFGDALTSTGLFDPTFWAMLLLPLFAISAMRPLDALLWAFLVFLAGVALFLFHPPLPPHPLTLQDNLISFTIVLLGLLFIVGTLRYSLDAYIARLLLQEQQLAQQTQQAQQQAEIMANLRQKAEANVESKSRFLTTMSHELRTPLNGIIGMLSLLQHTPLNDEQQELLQTLETSGDILLNIINDFLDLSKIDAGQLQLHEAPFQLRTCIEEVLKIFSPQAQQKELRLTHTIPPNVPPSLIADPLRFRQILLNLVGNAVKFTEQGEINISLEVDDQQLLCHIRDTGMGIQAEDLPSLFQDFHQLQQPANNTAGTGLGLAITKRLLTLMKGSISVESQPGEGSCFTFSLPLRVPKETSPEPQTSDTPSTPNPTHPSAPLPEILIAEDNEINQKVTQWTLQRAGYASEIVSNGLEALQRLDEKHFDLILMDMQMPVLDGLATTRKIRASFDPSRQPYIIALTANVLEPQRRSFEAAGIDDYLSKPLKRAELQQALQRYANQPTHTPEEEELLDLSALNSLRELCSYAPTSYQALFERLVQSTQKRLQKLQAAKEQDDLASIASIAYDLFSVSAMFGANRLSQQSRRLEKSALSLQQDMTYALIAQMHTTFHQSLTVLRTHMASTPKTPAPTTPDPMDNPVSRNS